MRRRWEGTPAAPAVEKLTALLPLEPAGSVKKRAGPRARRGGRFDWPGVQLEH